MREALQPEKTVPRALIGTLLCATILPVAASLALVGHVLSDSSYLGNLWVRYSILFQSSGFTPYNLINPSSGFAVAFHERKLVLYLAYFNVHFTLRLSAPHQLNRRQGLDSFILRCTAWPASCPLCCDLHVRNLKREDMMLTWRMLIVLPGLQVLGALVLAKVFPGTAPSVLRTCQGRPPTTEVSDLGVSIVPQS